ncbi:hypothetical protein PQX77_020331 [Marasmius sp. AFHP31]|nr:hypothetical protein PQX77_020331 [Marasmius sp. AFHP31]
MVHFAEHCSGGCLDGLASNLDLLHPAEHLPHGSVEFDDIYTEVLFALGVTAVPMVLEVVRCRQKVRHPINIILVGACYKIKRLDESEILPKRCNCPVWMYSWDTAVSRCINSASFVWNGAHREFEEEEEQREDALRDLEGLTPWEKARLATGGQRIKRELEDELEDEEVDSDDATDNTNRARKRAKAT